MRLSVGQCCFDAIVLVQDIETHFGHITGPALSYGDLLGQKMQALDSGPCPHSRGSACSRVPSARSATIAVPLAAECTRSTMTVGTPRSTRSRDPGRYEPGRDG